MAEDSGQGGGGKGGKSLIIVIAVAAALIAGVGAGAYFLGAKSAHAEKNQKQATAATTEGAEGKPASLVGPMIAIPSFISNILDKNGGTRYLKAAITLEADNAGTVAEIKERMPQIKDAILMLVSNKTFDDLRDLQGKMQLRAELLGRVNGILKTGKVTNIYFTDFVVQ
ncbi:MAG TPA: flagellar basal body-associated FliL family protein [Desulfuromonadales bacterium]|nr:flagellar basal body-associated FliL family protein [Desulfuromonadales bacterium]